MSGSSPIGAIAMTPSRSQLGRERDLVGEHDDVVGEGAAAAGVGVEADLDEHGQRPAGAAPQRPPRPATSWGRSTECTAVA